MWGTRGFTCTNVDAAERMYDKMKSGIEVESVVNFKIKSSKPKAGSTQPHLICLITGAARPTTLKYLTAKAEKYQASVDDIKNYYITKPAVKLIISGMSVERTRQALGVSIDTVITAASHCLVKVSMKLRRWQQHWTYRTRMTLVRCVSGML